MQTTSFITKDGLSIFITPASVGVFFSVYSRATHTTFNIGHDDARQMADRIISALDNHALETAKAEEASA